MKLAKKKQILKVESYYSSSTIKANQFRLINDLTYIIIGSEREKQENLKKNLEQIQKSHFSSQKKTVSLNI